MSEYWVSQQKHWCQYCRIYIADNKPSRTMHEQGKKHKENVEKFLRDIRRKDHENRKEDEKTRRELERIERAAMKQYKKDIILEAPGASMASLTSTRTNAPPVTSSFSDYDIIYAGPITSDSTSNYTEPTELSKSAGGTEAVMGDWRPVTPPPAPPPPVNNTLETDQAGNLSTSQEETLQDDEEEEDLDDLRNFKVVEKTFPLDDQIPEDYIMDKDSSKVTFKKRKFAGQAKTRNIRKKKC